MGEHEALVTIHWHDRAEPNVLDAAVHRAGREVVSDALSSVMDRLLAEPSLIDPSIDCTFSVVVQP